MNGGPMKRFSLAILALVVATEPAHKLPVKKSR